MSAGSVVIPLGTMGWIPSHRRETMCFAIDSTDGLILLDLGTGLSRLASEPGQSLLNKHRNAIVLLSHYHLDHTIGLTYLPHFFRARKVVVAGPGADICGQGVERALSRICQPPIFSLPLQRFPLEFEFHDLVRGENRIGDLLVHAISQVHSDPSIGIRVKGIVYITDTVCSSQTVEFSRKARILIHEAWLDRADYMTAAGNAEACDLTSHSHSDGVAAIAKEADVETLVLTHLNPAYDEARYQVMLEQTRDVFPRTMLSDDLVPIVC